MQCIQSHTDYVIFVFLYQENVCRYGLKIKDISGEEAAAGAFYLLADMAVE